MKNNRNTLLMVAGIMHIVRSVVCTVILVLVSTSLDVLDSALRLKIYRSDLYAYNTQAGEKLLAMIVIFIFLYLGFSIILNSVTGFIYLDQSKLGTAPLTMRKWIAIMFSVNIVLSMAIVPSVLAGVSLLVDKNQPDPFESPDAYSIHLKQKVNEIKKLKEDKTISRQEFLDMLTKMFQDE